MKRSEMLEKMVFSMELHAGNDPGWLDHQPGMKQGALDYANKILSDLEDEGMLPPENYGTNCPDPVIKICKEYFDEYVPSTIVIGWEKES